jgi:hypothetical protein
MDRRRGFAQTPLHHGTAKVILNSDYLEAVGDSDRRGWHIATRPKCLKPNTLGRPRRRENDVEADFDSGSAASIAIT